MGSPPVKRAAYSDRTAWLLAEMSRLAYVNFADTSQSLSEALREADFELVRTFDMKSTQAFLAKSDRHHMIVLAFRGTEADQPDDIFTDLKFRFRDSGNMEKIHRGFYDAFQWVEKDIKTEINRLGEMPFYITGHSLGGALALIATRYLDSDNIAACYTYGCPKVGNDSFGELIKAPVYRVVNALDVVPALPLTFFYQLLYLIPTRILYRRFKNWIGYDHYGDMRFLSVCLPNYETIKLHLNYSDFMRLVGIAFNPRQCIKDHSIDIYCDKLAQYAIKRWK